MRTLSLVVIGSQVFVSFMTSGTSCLCYLLFPGVFSDYSCLSFCLCDGHLLKGEITEW